LASKSVCLLVVGTVIINRSCDPHVSELSKLPVRNIPPLPTPPPPPVILPSNYLKVSSSEWDILCLFAKT
jgi:hypothetical protein